MYSVRQIIKENWKSYLKTHSPTAHQKEEIQKMIDCSKNSCNSRICSSCGKRYADDWANNLVNAYARFHARHVVLTTPSF
ncbi:transposase zinc-binding domain-containing protein [Candidatus Woesearchaeota archaeon]|nr:transposase zinc-binding domain-containing protein [Candidatus Woesearchaeota archaeon]